MLGLYIHLPFCLNKCPYCDFYSITFNETTAYKYTEAVIRNIEHYNERFDTVYFGGGTPMLMWDGICKILSKLRCNENAEITVEANPRTVSAESISALRDSGVNRISIGVQSLSTAELRVLGRQHSPDDAISAIKTAFDNGIQNISADIMMGTPRQAFSTLKRTIKLLTELPLTHISAYMLKVEEGTQFMRDGIKPSDDEEMRNLYLGAVELLKGDGLIQYEVSNFAKHGFECKHNLKYWRCQEYLGIGASAHSYYKGKRFETSSNIKSFLNSSFQEELTTDAAPGNFEEVAMLKLRLTEGMSFSECEQFGISKNVMIERIKIIPKGLLTITPNRIALTKEGFLVSNEIIKKLALGY